MQKAKKYRKSRFKNKENNSIDKITSENITPNSQGEIVSDDLEGTCLTTEHPNLTTNNVKPLKFKNLSKLNKETKNYQKITSKSITSTSEEEKEVVIDDLERPYLTANDKILPPNNVQALIFQNLNKKFQSSNVALSHIRRWIDSSIIPECLTVQEVVEKISKDSSVSTTKDFVGILKKKSIIAEKNKRLQNYRAALVIEYTKRLGGSLSLNKGEKLEPPIAVKKVPCNM